MATLEDFLPDVLPHCPGAPIPVAERQLLHAIRDFCARSSYWRADQLFTTVTDEVAAGEYQVAPPAGAYLASVLIPIEHAGEPLFLRTPEWLAENYSTQWRTATGAPAYFTMTTPTRVRLVPYPTVAVTNDLRVTQILQPALSSPTLDDVLLDYVEAIGQGAAARLKMMPDQQWTNEQVGVALGALFEEAIEEAKSMAIAKWQDRRHQRKRKTMGYYF
ncbi:MAG: hypothetical protein K2Y51_26015 [Gammaproteobacteria bacterium]|nr:hypothetical protein [Gammaproteobacteria bacterium]